MTDQDLPNDEGEFDDPAYDAIRDLLAAARVTEPVPDDVAARLDETLASLTADRRVEDVPDQAPSVVVPLRRRSRLAPRLLAAAAAVVVVGAGGVGLSQVLSNTGADDMASTPSAATAERSDDFGPAAPSAPVPRDAVPEVAPGTVDLNSTLQNQRLLPKFTTTAFATQVAAFDPADLRLAYTAAESAAGGDQNLLRDLVGTGASRSPAPSLTDGMTKDNDGPAAAKPQRHSFLSAAKAACPGPVGTDATLVPILYDGKPAALAVYREEHEAQLYEAWSCDGRTLLASTVVER